MNLLDEIREYHEDADNFEEITIKGNLFDVSVYALIERHFSRFLMTQVKYFPYILKTQWRTMWGKSRKSGHEALQKLINSKVVGEGHFKGCHYVYPLTRTMKWYTGDPRALPMRPRLTDYQLLDHFMRVEYFLQFGDPIHLNASDAFEEVNVLLDSIPQGTHELYLPKISLSGVNSALINMVDGEVDIKKIDQYTVLQITKVALGKLAARNCYLKKVRLTPDIGFHFELFIIHYEDSSRSRYHRLLNDMNILCSSLQKSEFSLYVLTDSEKSQCKADVILSSVFKQRAKKNVPEYCSSFAVINTNIARYYQRGDQDLNVSESELMEIQRIVRNLQSVAE